MFCEKCGTKMKENAMFCQNCGTALLNTQNNQTPTVSIEKGSSWSMSKIIKRVLLAVVIAIVIIWRLIHSNAVDTNNNGLSAYNSGNSEQAISQFSQAANGAISDDDKRASLINLGYVYASDSKNDLALSTFNEALVLASKDSFDYYLISGEIGLLEKKPDIALSNYKKAYQINPNDFQINNALNLFYVNIDGNANDYVNYPKALGYAQKAYEVSDDTIKNIAKQNLAIAYFFNKNYDQALPLFLSCDAIKEPYINYWLGLTYLGKNDATNGKLYLQKAKNAGVAIDPEISKYLD